MFYKGDKKELRVCVGDTFWGGTSAWHDKKIRWIVELIFIVGTHTCLHWAVKWYIALSVLKVTYISNI